MGVCVGRGENILEIVITIKNKNKNLKNILLNQNEKYNANLEGNRLANESLNVFRLLLLCPLGVNDSFFADTFGVELELLAGAAMSIISKKAISGLSAVL